MKSWDLFRTLVYARNGRPGEDSIENHYAIAENVCGVQPDDIIVSEYETERAAKAQAILHQIGLNNRLIVTPCGKSDATIWPQLKAQGLVLEEHIGDHYRCDIEGPSLHGIKATQVTQHLSTPWETYLESHGFPALSRSIKEARLSTWGEYRDLQLFQIETNFPFLFMAAREIAAVAKVKRLQFSSRDCFLLCRLMQRFYPQFESQYFFTSRLARYRGSESYREYARQASADALIIDLCGTGASLKHLFPDDSVLIVVGMKGCCVPHLMQGGIDESSNFAPHAMVADVKDGVPIFANPLNINWENWPELAAMQYAFDAVLTASQNYDWSADLQATPRLDVTLGAMYENSGPLAQHFTDIRVGEAHATARMIGDIPGVLV